MFYEGNLKLQSLPKGLRLVSQDYERIKRTIQIGGFEDVQGRFQVTQLQSRFLIDFQGKSTVGINNNNIMETDHQMSLLTSGAYKTFSCIPLPLSFLSLVEKPKSHKIHNSHSEPVDETVSIVFSATSSRLGSELTPTGVRPTCFLKYHPRSISKQGQR